MSESLKEIVQSLKRLTDQAEKLIDLDAPSTIISNQLGLVSKRLDEAIIEMSKVTQMKDNKKDNIFKFK